MTRLSAAEKTIERFLARAVRLYEQERGEPCGPVSLGLYVRRWLGWLRGITPERGPPCGPCWKVRGAELGLLATDSMPVPEPVICPLY
jgi:hypothetical protein